MNAQEFYDEAVKRLWMQDKQAMTGCRCEYKVRLLDGCVVSCIIGLFLTEDEAGQFQNNSLYNISRGYSEFQFELHPLTVALVKQGIDIVSDENMRILAFDLQLAHDSMRSHRFDSGETSIRTRHNRDIFFQVARKHGLDNDGFLQAIEQFPLID